MSSNKFLGITSSGNQDLSNGSTNIFAAVLGAANLNPSKALKTNSVNQLVSTNLEISDVNNLQSELDNVISNPFPGTLEVGTLKSDLLESTGAGTVNIAFNDVTGNADITANQLFLNGTELKTYDQSLNTTDSVSFASVQTVDPTAAQDVATKNYVDTSISAIPSDNAKLSIDGSIAMTGALDMGNNNINNVQNLTTSGNVIHNVGSFTHNGSSCQIQGSGAVQIQNGGSCQIQPTGPLSLKSFSTSGDIVMNSNKITGLLDPTAAQDASTKKYVDDNSGVNPFDQSLNTTDSPTFADITLNTDTIHIGNNAGAISQASNSIAIGKDTGFQNTTANSVYIGNSVATDGGGHNNVIVIGANTTGANPIVEGQILLVTQTGAQVNVLPTFGINISDGSGTSLTADTTDFKFNGDKIRPTDQDLNILDSAQFSGLNIISPSIEVTTNAITPIVLEAEEHTVGYSFTVNSPSGGINITHLGLAQNLWDETLIKFVAIHNDPDTGTPIISTAINQASIPPIVDGYYKNPVATEAQRYLSNGNYRIAVNMGSNTDRYTGALTSSTPIITIGAGVKGVPGSNFSSYPSLASPTFSAAIQIYVDETDATVGNGVVNLNDAVLVTNKIHSEGKINFDTGSAVEFYNTIQCGQGIDMDGFSVGLDPQKIINMADPTDPEDAATKAYVDTKAEQNIFDQDLNTTDDVEFSSVRNNVINSSGLTVNVDNLGTQYTNFISRLYAFNRPVSTSGFVLLSSTAVVNTTVETDLISNAVSTGLGSLTALANTAGIGSCSKLIISGVCETDSKEDLTLRIKLGTNLINELTFKFDDLNGVSSWKAEAMWTVKSIGVAGTLTSNAFLTYVKASGNDIKGSGSVENIVWDSTINQDLSITAQWSVALPTASIEALECITTNLWTPQ